MTKEEILDYVVNSPENTNRRVLSDMLDEFNSGSGGGGGSSVLIVKITSDNNWENFTCDKTFDEILAASNSLVPIFGYVGNETDGYGPVTFSSANPYGQVGFNTIRIFGDEEQYYLHETGYLISDDNTVTVFDNEFLLTPRT